MNCGRFKRCRSRRFPSLRPGPVLFLVAMLGLLTLAVPSAWAQTLLTDEDVAKIPAGDQPIAFSHKIHSTDNLIDCQYCHIYARRSSSSGVPPVAICVGCHKFVANNLAEVKKVLEYWDRQEPIPWVKIHDVPDFVRYPHYKHVNAKNEIYPDGILCQECHGPIEMMDVVAQAKPTFGQMGWCLECHLTIPGTMERKRAIAASTDPKKTKDAMHPNGNYNRPILSDCLTCHY